MSDDPLWRVCWSNDAENYVQAGSREGAIEAAYAHPSAPTNARVRYVVRVG